MTLLVSGHGSGPGSGSQKGRLVLGCHAEFISASLCYLENGLQGGYFASTG
jgi:hypothetical protein